MTAIDQAWKLLKDTGEEGPEEEPHVQAEWLQDLLAEINAKCGPNMK